MNIQKDWSDLVTHIPENVYYECGICDHYHKWEWDGDCREDASRLTLDDIPDNAEIRSMDDRVKADEL